MGSTWHPGRDSRGPLGGLPGAAKVLGLLGGGQRPSGKFSRDAPGRPRHPLPYSLAPWGPPPLCSGLGLCSVSCPLSPCPRCRPSAFLLGGALKTPSPGSEKNGRGPLCALVAARTWGQVLLLLWVSGCPLSVRTGVTWGLGTTDPRPPASGMATSENLAAFPAGLQPGPGRIRCRLPARLPLRRRVAPPRTARSWECSRALTPSPGASHGTLTTRQLT